MDGENGKGKYKIEIISLMKLYDLTIKQFLDKTASSEPMPAGGSALALCAALAASITEMVAKLVLEKAKYAQLYVRIREIYSELENTRLLLMRDIDRDAESYQIVLDAFLMPKDSANEIVLRRVKIQKALKAATLVQLDVAEKCHTLFNYIMEIANILEGSLAADNRVSLMICNTAAKGAIFNVKTNISQIDDIDFIEEVISKCDNLESDINLKY